MIDAIGEQQLVTQYHTTTDYAKQQYCDTNKNQLSCKVTRIICAYISCLPLT